MLLTIDIGNTNLTLGLYEGETLGPRWRLATDHESMPDEYGMQFVALLAHVGRSAAELTGICLASVVPPLTGKVVQACRQYLSHNPLVVDAGVRTGVRIRYEDPRAVGADRIADAAVDQLCLHGAAGLTVAAVATAAGISSACLPRTGNDAASATGSIRWVCTSTTPTPRSLSPSKGCSSSSFRYSKLVFLNARWICLTGRRSMSG